MDAISWRRLTSIVKSDLLSPKREVALAVIDSMSEPIAAEQHGLNNQGASRQRRPTAERSREWRHPFGWY
jgi:hypothetical protein